MKKNSLRLPALILAVGLVVALTACLFVNVVTTPTVTEQEFPYSVTYKLCGEVKTLEGVYKCTYNGYNEGEDPRDRYYTGEYTVDGQTTIAHSCTIAEHEGGELYIVTVFNDSYLMADTKEIDYEPALEAPYLEAVNKDGCEYEEGNMPAAFDAEIISWEYPEPADNTFQFSGFSLLHTGRMMAMLAVGLLVIAACVILVKRDQTLSYKALDKLSIVLNFAVVFAAIPFITFVTGMLQLTMDADSLLYQILLCIPALMAFTVAASVSLRRRGFAVAGFLIQFVGPVLFFVPVVLEEVVYNLFG